MEMLTSVKSVKGQSEIEKQRVNAFNDLFSTAVSRIRQPIESFFNRLNEKTKIQRAHKVRSTSGLLVHTMGKMAVAFIYLMFLSIDSYYLHIITSAFSLFKKKLYL